MAVNTRDDGDGQRRTDGAAAMNARDEGSRLRAVEAGHFRDIRATDECAGACAGHDDRPDFAICGASVDFANEILHDGRRERIKFG